ncbi:hypothetical protein D0T51_05905 [Parabacteroides sp. 52]|nr:hypothetical protein [Parabacteroides sp. 52]
MKIKVLFLFLLYCSFSYSQNGKEVNVKNVYSYEKAWLFHISSGVNIDLPSSTSNSLSQLLGSRADIAPVLGVRLTHLFSKRIGWYADLQMSFYKEKKSPYLNTSHLGDLGEALVDKLFWPVSTMRPSIHAGVLYRIEQKKWNLYPAIGWGYGCYLPDRKSERGKKNENGDQENVLYKQNASFFFLNLGLSAHYFISPNTYLSLNANFQQPLQKSSAYLIYSSSEKAPQKLSYQTTTAGRNLNICLGLGIVLGKKK